MSNLIISLALAFMIISVSPTAQAAPKKNMAVQ